MRTLGEQWVENGRMYKAVEGPKIVNGLMEGNTCHGCCHVDNWDDDCLHPSKLCPVGKGVIIKDIGPVNKDGCLPSDFGVYPEVYEHMFMGINGYKVNAYITDPHVGKYALGETRQEAIDAWNRRAI